MALTTHNLYYLRTINDAIDGFKELDELPWFDHDKIKSA